MTDSQSLLADYARNRSESAFGAIVTRYLDLVYSSAFRLLDGDAHRAKDVAQIVFADLARKAGELSPNIMLGGWLHRHTCFVAVNLQRTERRRLAREREAVEMKSLHEDVGLDFSSVAPLLDESINQLAEADRTAILLRFFEQKDFHAVGQSLDASEDAARMRVNRALDKLRDLLAQRGIQTPAGTLGIIISANAVQAAPAGLALTITTVCAFTTTTFLTTATNTIVLTTFQKTIGIATIAVLAGVGIYENRQAFQLRNQVEQLQQQLALMRDQVGQLDEALSAATNQLVALREDNARLNGNTSDLLRLRGQVGILRKESEELKQIRKANPQLAVASEAGSSNSPSSTKSNTVSKIVVTQVGQPRTTSEELIRTYISLTVGDTFDQSKVDRDVQNLYSTGLFYNMKVAQKSTDAGITLNYLIQEKPRLTAIKFAGNTKFRQPDLTALLASKTGESLDERTLFGDAQKIQERYAKSGFGDTKVRYSTHIYENLGEAVATFEIIE